MEIIQMTFILQTALEKDNKEEFVHLTTMAWNPYVSNPDFDGRQHELSKLSSYLEYLEEQCAYEVRATNLLRLAKEKFIERALSDYESRQTIEAENRDWAWSSMFQVLLLDLPKTAPPRPWKHTEEELIAILRAIEGQYQGEKTTLEYDCPHVVRVLKLHGRLAKTRFSPMSHPTLGCTRLKLLEMASDDVESQRLLFCAQQLSEFGWTLFPCICSDNVEPLSNCAEDVNSLIGVDRTKQEAVFLKIQLFFSRMAQRALLDMRQTSNTYKHLLAMWTLDHSESDISGKDELNQVSSLKYGIGCQYYQ